MSIDQVTPPQPPKKKGGWPKGKPRGTRSAAQRAAIHEPIHSKGNPNVIVRNGKTYEYIQDDDNDRLRIDPSIVPDGMVYMWMTNSILGKEEPQWRARRMRTGWSPVPASRHDGVWMPKGHEGEIVVDACTLVEKPKEFVDRDQKRDKIKAAEQVYIREQAMRSGNPDGSIGFDTDHQSARKVNRISKSYERIDVPE